MIGAPRWARLAACSMLAASAATGTALVDIHESLLRVLQDGGPGQR